MLPLDCDRLPHWPDCTDFVFDRLKKTIHIPAELALRDSTVVEQLIDSVFDLLGSCSVELWVCVEPHRHIPPLRLLSPNWADLVFG
jgi:hypothetical protein